MLSGVLTAIQNIRFECIFDQIRVSKNEAVELKRRGGNRMYVHGNLYQVQETKPTLSKPKEYSYLCFWLELKQTHKQRWSNKLLRQKYGKTFYWEIKIQQSYGKIWKLLNFSQLASRYKTLLWKSSLILFHCSEFSCLINGTECLPVATCFSQPENLLESINQNILIL